MNNPNDRPWDNTRGAPFVTSTAFHRDATQYRAPHPLSDVAVPALLALVSAIAAALATIWLCYEIDALDVMFWVPFAFLATFGGVWIWRLRQHNEHLHAAEETTATEPPPPPAPVATGNVKVTLSVPRVNEDGQPYGNPQVRLFNLPCSEQTLVDVAQTMLAGYQLTESEWTPIAQGKPFSEGSLRSFKQTLITQKLATWISPSNPRIGMKLTDQGKQFMTTVIAKANAGEDVKDNKVSA